MWIWIAAGVAGIYYLSKRQPSGSVMLGGQTAAPTTEQLTALLETLASYRNVNTALLTWAVDGSRVTISDENGYQLVDAIGYEAARIQVEKYRS